MYLSPQIEKEFHRTVVVSLLDSAFGRWGSAKEVAQALGVTEECVSRWRNETLPSLARFEQIAETLMMDEPSRSRLLKHIRFYFEGVDEDHTIRQGNYYCSDLVEMIREETKSALSGQAGEDIKEKYSQVLSWMTDLFNLIDDPDLSYVDLIIGVCRLSIVLNRPECSLFYTKVAHYILADIPAAIVKKEYRWYTRLQIHILQLEAQAYQHLGLLSEAAKIICSIDNVPGWKTENDRYLPDIYRDRIEILSTKKRIALGTVNQLAEHITRSLWRRENAVEAVILDMLGQRCLGQAYIIHAQRVSRRINLKKAHTIFQTQYAILQSAQGASVLHKALMLKTYAFLFWVEGDYEGWHEMAKQTIAVCQPTGFTHIIDTMRHEYGENFLALA